MWGFLREDWRYYAALALIVLAVALLFASARHARAHMHSRPDLTEWLRTLYSLRSPCCDSTDAETMADPDWKIAANPKDCVPSEPWKASEEFHFCVRLQDQSGEWQWWQVGDSALVQVPNRAGPALIWLYWAATGRPFIRCFLPGTLG